MKFLLLFVIIILNLLKVEVLSRSFKSYSMRNAFVNISKHLSIRNHLLQVVDSGVEGKATKSSILSTFAGIPHVVAELESKSRNFELNTSSIVLIDNVYSLEKFNRLKIVSPRSSVSQQMFIYVHSGTFDKLAEIDAKKSHIHLEYFVIEEEKSIRLLTFIWYKPKKCNESQLVEVNRFDKSMQLWQHGTFKINKFSNFCGCKINFSMEAGMPHFLAIEIDDESQVITKCRGYTCAIVKDFSSALNYSYNLNMYYEYDTPPRKWPNILYNFVVMNYALNCLPFHTNDYDQSLLTRPVFFVEQYLTIPPGEEYNGYEKLVLPFDDETWMWIAITFASAFVTIFVMKFVPLQITNFVMGRGVETPALNVIRAFFGISQIVSPARNFARYLLMMFILFSLVIRTAYQGKMFEFLQKEIRKPTVTTVDEMIDNKFTFYMQYGFKSQFPHLDFTRRANIIDDWSRIQLDAAYKQTYIPGSKTAVYYKEGLYDEQVRFRLNRNDPPKLLKERYMLETYALWFGGFSPVFDNFDQKLQRYIEADLINYSIRRWIEKSDPKRFEKYEEPFAVLTLEELEAGFVVCLVPLVLTVLVFGIEWIPTLKNLLVFLFIFKKYFDLKKLEQSEHSALMKEKIALWQKMIQDDKQKHDQ